MEGFHAGTSCLAHCASYLLFVTFKLNSSFHIDIVKSNFLLFCLFRSMGEFYVISNEFF